MTYLHGETKIFRSELPEDAKKLDVTGYKIIAPSEVSGNHHVVDITEGVEIYEKEGTLFVKNSEQATVRCLVKERHDDIILQPGVWEIGFQKEYDYLSDESRIVAD